MRLFLFLEVRLNFRYRFNVFSLSDSASFFCNCFSDKDVRVLKGGKKKKGRSWNAFENGRRGNPAHCLVEQCGEQGGTPVDSVWNKRSSGRAVCWRGGIPVRTVCGQEVAPAELCVEWAVSQGSSVQMRKYPTVSLCGRKYAGWRSS